MSPFFHSNYSIVNAVENEEVSENPLYDFVEYDVPTGKQNIIPFKKSLYYGMPEYLEPYKTNSMTPRTQLGIVDEDNRLMVQNTKVFPYSSIDMINAVGSGALIQRDLVLTSAHAVWNKEHGFFLYDGFYPGLSGNNTPFDKSDIKKIDSPNSRLDSPNMENDIALVKLDKPIGETTGWQKD